MVVYLCDVKNSLKEQVERLNKLECDKEAIRSQLSAELDVLDRKYRSSLQTNADERETARAVEEALREHYGLLSE